MSSAYEQMRVNIVLGVQGLKNPELARKELQKLGLTAEEADAAIRSLTTTTERSSAATETNTKVNKQNTIGAELRRKAKEKSIKTEKLETEEINRNTGAMERNSAGRTRMARLAQKRAEETGRHVRGLAELTDETKLLSDAEAMESKILERLNLKRAEANLLTRNAVAGYSDAYLKFAKAEALGKPALMRTAQWGAIGIAGLAYTSIKQYADFNKLLVQSVTHAGRKMTEVPFFSEKLLQISKETGQSAHDLAESMYRVASGTAAWNKGLGASKETVIQLTRMVSDLTTIGNIKSGVQQEQAARVITALVNSGMKGIGGEGEKGASKRAAALINSAIGAGDIKMSEMVSAMGRGVLMSGKTAGLSASDVMSWVDLLTTHGTTGSVAGTYVKTAINQFLNPTAQGAKAYAMIGIDPFTLSATARKGGLGAAVDLFNQKLTEFNPFKNYPKTKGKEGYAGAVQQLQMWAANQFPPELLAKWKSGALNAEEQAKVNSLIFTKAFGGSKGFTTMAMLLGESQQFHNIQTAIDRNATQKKFEEAKKLAENTPAMQFQRIKNRIVADLISIGETLAPFAVTLGKFAANAVHYVTVFKPLLIGIASWLGIIIGLAIKAKVAGMMKGMYGPLGSAYKMTDKLWGGISKIPGFGWAEKFVGKGGKHFRQIEEIETNKIFTKLGQDLAIFGDGAFKIDAAANKMAAAAGVDTGPLSRGGSRGGTGAGTGAGAGGGSGTKERGSGWRGGRLEREERRLARAAEREAARSGALKRLPGGLESPMYSPGWSDRGVFGRRRAVSSYLKRTAELRRYAGPGPELDFARRYMMGGDLYGKRMSKAEIGRHFGTSDSAVINDIFNRLSKHRIAGGGFTPEAMEIFRRAAHPDFQRGGLMTKSEQFAAKYAAKAATGGGSVTKIIASIAGKSGGAAKLMSGAGSIVGKVAGSGAARFLGGLGMESVLGMGAGMLTGPMGLALMTALPLAMPYITGGLRSLFGGGAGQTIDTAGTGVATLGGTQKQISDTEKALNAALGAYTNGKHNRKQVAKIMRLQEKLQRLKGVTAAQRKDSTTFARIAFKNIGGLKEALGGMGGTSFVRTMAGSNTKYKSSRGLYTRKQLKEMGLNEEAINGYMRVLKPYMQLSKERGYGGSILNVLGHESNLAIKNKQGEYIGASAAAYKYFQNTLKLQAEGLSGPLLSEAANKIDPNILANLNFNKYKKTDTKLGAGLYKYAKAGKFSFGGNKKAATARYLELEQKAMEAAQQAKGLQKIAGQKGLSAENRTRYLAEATALQTKAKEFQKAATSVAQTNMLTKNDISTLAAAIGRAVAKEYNLKPEDIKNAFVDGLNQASGGLATLVNRHNTNANARA